MFFLDRTSDPSCELHWPGAELTPPKASKPAAPTVWNALDDALQGWDVMVSMQDNPVPQVENPQTPLRSRQGEE